MFAAFRFMLLPCLMLDIASLFDYFMLLFAAYAMPFFDAMIFFCY